MNIDRIGGISGNYSSSNHAKNQKENQIQSDSVVISETAKNRISLHRALELVKSASDIRQEKIQTAKNNLPGYFEEGNINSEVTEKIAKKIAEDMKRGLL